VVVPMSVLEEEVRLFHEAVKNLGEGIKHFANAIDHLESMNGDLRRRVECLTDLIDRIENWCRS